MKKHYRHENDCLNCGTELQGKYCHVCGQENLEIKETFGHMMNHAISDYFHFDHQFFHTLKPLLFKPGFLTNEYMAGRRAQYLHPVKMYIFISLVYFVLFFQKDDRMAKVEYSQDTIEQVTAAAKAIKQSPIPQQAKDEALEGLYRDNGYIMAGNRLVKDTSKKAREKLAAEMANPHIITPGTKDTSYGEYLVNQKALDASKRDGWFLRYYNKKAFAINAQKVNIKEVVSEGIAHDFPKMMFILLPLFALTLLITFRRNKKFYVEHLIYAFHLHCFIFLFLTMLMIINFIIPANWYVFTGWLTFAGILVIIWYVYRSLRVVYHRSALRTITKMIGISLIYLLAFSICMALLTTIIVFNSV